jgi:hypothetical protein
MIVSCSWCHAAVALPAERYCLHCGHRGDVARGDCDCPRCRGSLLSLLSLLRDDAAARDPLAGLVSTGPITICGVWDDGRALIEPLEDLVEAALRAGDPIDDRLDALVDALITLRGLRIAE